jgi:MFS family permease
MAVSPFFGWISDIMGYRRMHVLAGVLLLVATAVLMGRAPVTEKYDTGEVPHVSG